MHCNYIKASENLQKCIHLFGVCTQYSLTRHVINLLVFNGMKFVEINTFDV